MADQAFHHLVYEAVSMADRVVFEAQVFQRRTLEAQGNHAPDAWALEAARSRGVLLRAAFALIDAGADPADVARLVRAGRALGRLPWAWLDPEPL